MRIHFIWKKLYLKIKNEETFVQKNTTGFSCTKLLPAITGIPIDIYAYINCGRNKYTQQFMLIFNGKGLEPLYFNAKRNEELNYIDEYNQKLYMDFVFKNYECLNSFWSGNINSDELVDCVKSV